jgi:hypothetical protein
MNGSTPLKVPVASPDSGSSRKPRDVVPGRSTPGGGSRRYVQSQQLVRNLDQLGSYDSNTAAFRISIPSSRLHAKVTVGMVPLSGEWIDLPQSGIAAWSMDIREFSRTDEGRYVPGGLVAQGLILPNSWEAVTLSAEWRGTITVPFQYLSDGLPTDGTGLFSTADLYVVAEWEPAAGESPIPDDELELLFGACRLTVDQAITVFSQVGA